MKDCKLYCVEKVYKLLTSKLEKENPNLYQLCELVSYISGLDDGYIVTNKCKPTNQGTKFTYTLVKNKAELNEYKLKLQLMQRKIIAEQITNELILSEKLIKK